MNNDDMKNWRRTHRTVYNAKSQISRNVHNARIISRCQVLFAAAAASLKRTRKAAHPNLYMWVKISNLPLARYIVVPVDFTTIHRFRAGRLIWPISKW